MGTNKKIMQVSETMGELSLKQAMNDILQQIKSADFDVANKKISPCLLTEIDAYSAVDRVLKSLHKQQLEADSQYKDLIDLRGADDPLAEIASDWLESTESAIETRMIELRRKRKLKAQALFLMEAAREEVEEANKKASLAYKKRLMDFDFGILTEKQAKAASEEGALNIVLLLMLLERIVEQTRTVMSLVSAFSDASFKDNEVVWAT